MNKLIVPLSILRTSGGPLDDKAKEYKASPDSWPCFDFGEFSVRGIQTNEAPAKFFVQQLARKGSIHAIQEIICVCSREANLEIQYRLEEEDFKKSAYSYFSDSLEKFCADKGIAPPVFNQVVYSENYNLTETLEKLAENIEDGDTIYFDTTGGFRNSAYLLMMLVRLLEYKGAKLGAAAYSNFETQNIENVTSVYELFNMLNGASEFAGSGRSAALRAAFCGDNTDINSGNVVGRLLSVMSEFSDELSLCRTDRLGDILSELNEAVLEVGGFTPNNYRENFLKLLIPLFGNKISFLTDKEITYPGIVKWCAENGMIQQALTIYTEKIPDYFYDKHWIVDSDLASTESRKGLNENASLYMRSFWEDFLTEDPKIDCLRIFIQKNRWIFVQPYNGKRITYNELEINKQREIEANGIKNGVCNIIAVRDAFYDDDDIRRPDSIIRECLKHSARLSKFVGIEKRLKGKNTEKFMNEIVQSNGAHPADKQLLCLFMEGISYREYSSEKKESPLAKRIYIIKNMEQIMAKSKRFSVNISSEDLQRLSSDYLYMKYVRNHVNHASDNLSDQEANAFFKDQGYAIENNINYENLQKTILDSVDYIMSVKKTGKA